MRTIRELLLLTLYLSSGLNAAETDTCKRCHPKIFNEYQNSMHKRASIYNDPVHAAVWQKHPARETGAYRCAKCHTPADPAVREGKTLPEKTGVQTEEPIACSSCHTIEKIVEHPAHNENIYTKSPKTFFAADSKRKGEKVTFHEERRFFGLLRTTTGSPYHNIDYGNENFYNGGVCLGCHEHKKNAKGFAVCDIEIEQEGEKENCITCHMPKIKGSSVTLHERETHAYHGSNIVTASPAMLQKYVILDLKKRDAGFDVTIENRANHALFPHPLRRPYRKGFLAGWANHALFPHPLRLAELRVSVQKSGQQLHPEPRTFARIIGTEGNPSSPWLADSVIHDTTIKAHEKRTLSYDIPLERGDSVTVTLGYHIVNPKMAEKLGITEEHYIRFIPFTQRHFSF